MPRLDVRHAGVAVLVLLAVAGTVFALRLVGDRVPATEVSPTGTALPRPSTLAQATDLRTEPRAEAPAVQPLPAGSRLQLIGRTAAGDWLFVSPADRLDLVGWVLASTLGPGDFASLAVIDISNPHRPPGTATPGGPQPDLVLRSVAARQDRLLVVVSNDGQADFNGTILVTVEADAPRRIDVGKPLARGQAIEAVLNTVYVQRRAQVILVVSSPDVPELSTANNRLEAIVTPDVPIDLAIEAASVDGSGRLAVTLRNHGPIPLIGTLTIGVRERPPTNRLVAMLDAGLDVAAEDVQRFLLTADAGAPRIDLSRMQVSITTDAIADADPANDTFPR